MRCSQTITVALALALMPAAPASTAAQTSTSRISEGLQLELKALQALRKRRSGKIRFHHTSISPEFGNNEWNVEVAFDGDKYYHRVEDRRFQKTEILVLTDRELISCEITPGAEPQIGILTADFAEQINRRSAFEECMIYDPHFFGVIAPLPRDRTASLERVLGAADRLEETVTDERLNGHPVKHIHFRRGRGGALDFWIAPEMDHAVLKVEAASNRKTVIVESEAVQWPGDVWFPKKILFRERVKATGEVSMQDTITIESAEFNIPVDPAQFTLHAFEPKIGQTIRRNGLPMIWDGRKLLSQKAAAGLTPEELAHPDLPWWRSIYVAFAAVFAVLAVLLLLRNRRPAIR